MGRTHAAFASAYWAGGTLGLDYLAVQAGHPAPVNVGAALIGSFIAPVFSAGWLSPDGDRIWAPGPPSHNYHWAGHRGWTHRFWFAFALTALTLMVYTGLVNNGFTASAAVLAFAPVTGWWSHLVGDMIFGQLKIAGAKVGLGLDTGGKIECGGPLVKMEMFGTRLRFLSIPTYPVAKTLGVLTPVLLALYVVLPMA